MAADDAARAVKRRGILAAAGAVIAGIVARQSAGPVSAFTGGSDGTPLIIGANDALAPSGTPTKNTETYPTQLTNTFGPVTAIPPLNRGLGLVVTGSDGASGIVGFCNGAAGTGVSGQSDRGFGVIGSVGGGGGTGGYGVYGTTTNATSFGVYGVTGVASSYGIHGHHSDGGVGVGGESETGTGVYGVTHASFNYGVLGTTDAANATAIAGIANTNGSSAFSGGTTNPAAFAAFFQGTVVVQGNFAVTGAKSAVVQHPRTGDHRLVYCVEAPEAWFEDFGKAQLAGGKATVNLDADFAALVHTDDYHVFLTPEGDCSGLYVTDKGATGFTVRELRAGASTLAFSWRAVGKRADVKGERLGKFTMPTLPLPDPAKFKAPGAPIPAVP